MPRTVKAVDDGLLYLTFGGAEIASIWRVDPASAAASFHVALGKGMSTLFKEMGWDVPGDKSSLEKLDGKLEGGYFILTAKADDEQLKLQSKDGKVNTEAEVQIDFGVISKFACHRFEIKGRKKKGFRRELRFEATVKDEDAMARLEGYMQSTGNARGSLKVAYLKEPEQTTIEDIPDVQAPDQTDVLEGMVEEINKKRGRAN